MSSSREVPAKFVESWRTEYIQTFNFLNVRIEAVRLEAKKLADREVNLLTPEELDAIVDYIEQAQAVWEHVSGNESLRVAGSSTRLYASDSYDWGDSTGVLEDDT